MDDRLISDDAPAEKRNRWYSSNLAPQPRLPCAKVQISLCLAAHFLLRRDSRLVPLLVAAVFHAPMGPF